MKLLPSCLTPWAAPKTCVVEGTARVVQMDTHLSVQKELNDAPKDNLGGCEGLSW